MEKRSAVYVAVAVDEEEEEPFPTWPSMDEFRIESLSIGDDQSSRV